MYFEEVFRLKCTHKRTAGIHEALFGYNQRTLPDGNNEAQKLTLTSTFRYLN